MKRIVITGLGCMTPLGTSVAEFWQRLCAGERGLGRLQLVDPTGLRNERGGEVGEVAFEPGEFGLKGLPDRATRLLLLAVREAWHDARLPGAGGPRAGAVMSTNFGGAPNWERYCAALSQAAAVADKPTEPPGKGQLNVGRERPGEGHGEAEKGHGEVGEGYGEAGLVVGGGLVDSFREFSFHRALQQVCQAFGLGGPASLLSIACASGAAAVGYALDLLRDGQADIMIAGGHDTLAPSSLSGLSTLHTITADDLYPFSANRSGTLFGEGAGVMVLESLESAQARGVRVYAEVLGAWQNNNAYHLTAPDKGGAGMAKVLAEALAEAGLPGRQLDYINAHGTGTVPHDQAETEAIKRVLGEHAYQTGVSSIKGAITHLMGAAGAVEAIATVKALETGIMPPTTSYGEPDPACDLDYVTEGARPAAVQYAATISAGMGGSNACVVMGREAGAHPLPAETVDEVWVTGMGPISAVGIGWEDFAAGINSGREGRRPAQRLAGVADELPLLAECLDFYVDDYLESQKTYLDRCSELTLAACSLALQAAGLHWRELASPRFGLSTGTAWGCLDSMLNQTRRVQGRGVRFGSPIIFTHSFANSPTSLAAIEYQIEGPTATFCVGSASGAAALDYGRCLIASGRADVVLAGGVEALSEPLLQYLEQAEVSYVPGEGAGLWVLERPAHARARGARPWAQIIESRVSYDLPGSKAEGGGEKAAERWGFTFGASVPLELMAALAREGEGAEEIVSASSCPEGGPGARVVVRRAT
jgi:3-oxoacyl-(acyl-carrier-protein) synthase